MVANNSKIVFFGDSLTHRTGLTLSPIPVRKFSLDYTGNYADILVKKLFVHYPQVYFEYYNLGIGGNTLISLLERIDDVFDLNPDWVILFIGQNDANNFSPAEYSGNLEKLLTLFQKKGIKIIQLSTTPNPDIKKNEILEKYDQIIRELCEKYNNYYVEVKKPFSKILKYNELADNPIKVFNQGCHLSELGNILIADLVFKVIEKI